MRFFLAFFFFLTLTRFATCETSRNCSACASFDLKSRWYLTGLAHVADTYFVDNCNNRASSVMTEPCSGPCMTLVFDNPDGAASTTPIYVVRGCHQSLTNVVTNRGDDVGNGNGNGNGGSRFCEIDNTFRMADRQGNLVNVRMMNLLCADGDRCNSDGYGQDFASDLQCSNQTNNNLLNNAPLNCYECLPSEGNNCHDSKCTKKYCSKQQIKLDGGFQLMKSCSNVNILGVDNACQTYDVVTNQGGIPVRSQYTQCYCKDKQFCNSTLSAFSIHISVVSVSVLSYFFSARLL